jgi:hypothetical protein
MPTVHVFKTRRVMVVSVGACICTKGDIEQVRVPHEQYDGAQLRHTRVRQPSVRCPNKTEPEKFFNAAVQTRPLAM